MNIANPYMQGPNAEEAHHIKLRRWASCASLAMAVVLIITKIAAYAMTNSVSIMTSLMDSIFDAVASGIMLLSIFHASTPADENHRFGHGKLEALAAMGQALFILASAGFLFFEAINRFLHPQPVKDAYVGIGVMLFSIFLTACLICFQRYVIQKTKSVGISADHLHYKGDLLLNGSVLLALLLTYYSPWPYFDPLFAACIALALLYGARDIATESFDILMDKELPNEDREKIQSLVNRHTSVRAVHDLRTRHSGQRIFIEFHLELDGDLSLTEAHDITEEIEMVLYQEFPKAEVLIHPEPAGLDDHRLDDQLKN